MHQQRVKQLRELVLQIVLTEYIHVFNTYIYNIFYISYMLYIYIIHIIYYIHIYNIIYVYILK